MAFVRRQGEVRINCSTKVSDDRNRSSRCNALQAVENSISKAQPLQVAARAKEAVARYGDRGDRHRNESAAAGNRLTSLRLGEVSRPPERLRAASGGSLGGVRSSKLDRAVITGLYPLTCMALVKLVKQKYILAWSLCHLCTRLTLRFSPGCQSSTVLLPRANLRPRAEAHSQVGSLTARCGDEKGNQLIQLVWTAVAGVTFVWLARCRSHLVCGTRHVHEQAWRVTNSKLLVSIGGQPRLSLTHSLGLRSCAATAAIAWQGKWQTHFPLHKSPAIWFFGNIFRGCQLLNSITAPGCVEFGYKAFADCCPLQRIHANGGGVNQFRSATKFERFLF